jgi:hypothetical protein
MTIVQIQVYAGRIEALNLGTLSQLDMREWFCCHGILGCQPRRTYTKLEVWLPSILVSTTSSILTACASSTLVPENKTSLAHDIWTSIFMI